MVKLLIEKGIIILLLLFLVKSSMLFICFFKLCSWLINLFWKCLWVVGGKFGVVRFVVYSMVLDSGVFIWWVNDVIMCFKEERCCRLLICDCNRWVFVKLVIKMSWFVVEVEIVKCILCLLCSEILWLLLLCGVKVIWIMLYYFLFMSGIFSKCCVFGLVLCIMFWVLSKIILVGIIFNICL